MSTHQKMRTNDYADQMRGLFMFLYNAEGWRTCSLSVKEAAELTWDSLLNAEGRLISMRTERLGLVQIPMTAGFKEWLQIGPLGAGSQPVFPLLRGQRRLRRRLVEMLAKSFNLTAAN